MEFKEFANVEGRDYDLYSNDGTIKNNQGSNPYVEQLADLIGILEEDELAQVEQYGITVAEYFNPTEETINKVKEALGVRRGK